MTVWQIGDVVVAPILDEGSVGIVHFDAGVAPLNPRFSVGGLQHLHHVDRGVGEHVGQPTVAGGVPSDDAAASFGVPPLSRHRGGNDDVAHPPHAGDVKASFIEMDADVEVVHRRGKVAGVDAVNAVRSRSLVVVQNVTDHDEIVGVAVVVVQRIGLLDVDQFSGVDDVDQLEAVVASNPQGVGLCAGHQSCDPVRVKDTARGPEVQPRCVDEVPACDTNAVEADVSDVADDGHGRIVCTLRFPRVDHAEGAAGDDANAAERTAENVRAVVAEGVGGPIWHAVVHREAFVDVQSTGRIQLPPADAEVGGGIQIRAQIHEFEVLAGSFVPVASTRNVVRTASVPQDGPGLGADGELC